MNLIIFLSEAAVPIIVVTIVTHGWLSGIDIYKAFIDGASEGIKTVSGILPTLVGLMTAVGVLSGSGALKAFAELVSAQKIDEASISAMLNIIQKVYKEKTIQLTTHINPELIGGFVLNVENNKLDASVAGELNTIKKELKLYNPDSRI